MEAIDVADPLLDSGLADSDVLISKRQEELKFVKHFYVGPTPNQPADCEKLEEVQEVKHEKIASASNALPYCSIF